MESFLLTLCPTSCILPLRVPLFSFLFHSQLLAELPDFGLELGGLEGQVALLGGEAPALLLLLSATAGSGLPALLGGERDLQEPAADVVALVDERAHLPHQQPVHVVPGRRVWSR